LAQLLRHQGWKVECDSSRKADLEVLALPGSGRFQGRGECRVAAMFDEKTRRLPWSARRAQIVLSPTGSLGRPDQLRLRLADNAAFWQSLLIGQAATPNRIAASTAAPPRTLLGYSSQPSTSTA
jgi:hypothetical protein